MNVSLRSLLLTLFSLHYEFGTSWGAMTKAYS